MAVGIEVTVRNSLITGVAGTVGKTGWPCRFHASRYRVDVSGPLLLASSSGRRFSIPCGGIEETESRIRRRNLEKSCSGQDRKLGRFRDNTWAVLWRGTRS